MKHAYPGTQNPKDYVVLHVDKELLSLKYFRRAFENKFRIITASDTIEGYRIFETQKANIGLIITEEKMPVETGLQFLEKVQFLQPETGRILVMTSLAPNIMDKAFTSLTMHQCIRKPWDLAELELIMEERLERFTRLKSE